MPKKLPGGELSDEEILRIARMRITESAAATFSQQTIDTQLSVERGVIWMIHFIEFHLETLNLLNEVAAGSFEFVDAQVTRESKDAIIRQDDADLLQRTSVIAWRSAVIGTDAGPLYNVKNEMVRYDYPTPLPYASQSLFLGVKGSHASASQIVSARVGYSVRGVSDKYFFRVAQALLG